MLFVWFHLHLTFTVGSCRLGGPTTPCELSVIDCCTWQLVSQSGGPRESPFLADIKKYIKSRLKRERANHVNDVANITIAKA